jgi:hypothetical protein
MVIDYPLSAGGEQLMNALRLGCDGNIVLPQAPEKLVDIQPRSPSRTARYPF